MATDFYSDFHVPVVETDKGKVRGFLKKAYISSGNKVRQRQKVLLA